MGKLLLSLIYDLLVMNRALHVLFTQKLSLQVKLVAKYLLKNMNKQVFLSLFLSFEILGLVSSLIALKSFLTIKG